MPSPPSMHWYGCAGCLLILAAVGAVVAAVVGRGMLAASAVLCGLCVFAWLMHLDADTVAARSRHRRRRTGPGGQ
jgi:hypothetical protein